MKTRYKILIIFGMIFLVLFASFVILKITFYETWMNNEYWYDHPKGYDVECEFRLFGNPGLCIAINEDGNTVDTKTEMGNWMSLVKRWTPPPMNNNTWGAIEVQKENEN